MTQIDAYDSAAELSRWLGVQPATVRMWARRGHITRHPGDRYDAAEVNAWWETRRSARHDEVRQGLASLSRAV